VKSIFLSMIRDDLRGFPEPELPAGYSARLWHPGDEEAWISVQRASDTLSEITRRTIEENFGRDLTPMETRSFFLVAPDGADVGSITAWHGGGERDGDWGREWGRIHWVAIVPLHQGRGLAKPMMAVAMRCLAESHEKAYLTTSSGRLPALKVYLDFGFRPNMSEKRAAEGWREVKGELHHPALEEMDL